MNASRKVMSVLGVAMMTAGLSGCFLESGNALSTCFIADGVAGIPGNLYRVELSTGALTTVGALTHGITGMAFAPDGTLYATESTEYASTKSFSSLLKINTETAQVTEVGQLQDAGMTTQHDAMPDIAFIGSTLYGWTEDSDDLATIDTATGEVTVIGDSTLSSYGSGMATLNGTLYTTAENVELRTLDETTGTEASFVGAITNLPFTGNPIDAMTSRNGMLYGINGGDDGGPTDMALVMIDPATAVATTIASYTGVSFDAIACK